MRTIGIGMTTLMLVVLLVSQGFSQILVDKDKKPKDEDKFLGSGYNGPYYRPGPTSEHWWDLGTRNKKSYKAEAPCEGLELTVREKRGTTYTIRGSIRAGIKWPAGYSVGADFSGEKTWTTENEVTAVFTLGPCRWIKLTNYEEGRKQECYFIYLRFLWPSGVDRKEYSRTREEWDWVLDEKSGNREDCYCPGEESELAQESIYEDDFLSVEP